MCVWYVWYTFVHARKHACMHVCVYVCMYVCTYVCIHVCMYVCMHACMHTCMHACMHACMHTYIHTCIHTCIHTYTHMQRHLISFRICMHLVRKQRTSSTGRSDNSNFYRKKVAKTGPLRGRRGRCQMMKSDEVLHLSAPSEPAGPAIDFVGVGLPSIHGM